MLFLSWIKDPNIQELFSNGRHYKITFILILQYAVSIPPDMRGNLDYIYILSENFVNIKKKLYEHYAGMFPSYNLFDQVFTEVTKDYGCLVLDNLTKNKELTSQAYWYKAREVPNFKFGDKKLWRYHKKKYNKNWAKSSSIINTEDIVLKKKSKITIKKCSKKSH